MMCLIHHPSLIHTWLFASMDMMLSMHSHIFQVPHQRTGADQQWWHGGMG